MPVISVRVTQDGFHVSPELARELGLKPGDEARLEIRRALDTEAVRNLSLRYAWRRLGDAVGIEEPAWDGDSWMVPLKVRGYSGRAGCLRVSEDGQVLTDRSTSKQELLEWVTANATP